MNTRRKHPLLVATVAVLGLAGSVTGWADGGYYRQESHGHGFYPGHDYHAHRYPGRTYYRSVQKKKVVKHDDGHDNDNLLIGLLVGGLVGYAISYGSGTEPVHYDRYPVTRYAH